MKLINLLKILKLKYFTIKSIYIKRFVRPLVSEVSSFVCPPGDKQFVCPPGTNISHTQLGRDKHFHMIKIMIENVSEANILSSEARKPPEGARISGPVGP